MKKIIFFYSLIMFFVYSSAYPTCAELGMNAQDYFCYTSSISIFNPGFPNLYNQDFFGYDYTVSTFTKVCGDVLKSPTPIPGECICTLEYAPVCGTDGETYSNLCFANCAGAGEGVGYGSGPCLPAGAINNCICPALYAPVCGSDGFTYTNSCWATCAGVSVVADGNCGGGTKYPAPSYLLSQDFFCYNYVKTTTDLFLPEDYSRQDFFVFKSDLNVKANCSACTSCSDPKVIALFPGHSSCDVNVCEGIGPCDFDPITRACTPDPVSCDYGDCVGTSISYINSVCDNGYCTIGTPVTTINGPSPFGNLCPVESKQTTDLYMDTPWQAYSGINQCPILGKCGYYCDSSKHLVPVGHAYGDYTACSKINGRMACPNISCEMYYIDTGELLGIYAHDCYGGSYSDMSCVCATGWVDIDGNFLNGCETEGRKCGNGVCDVDENEVTCPLDCSLPPVCGNALCEYGESISSCPADCPPETICGDFRCDDGETFANCPKDCPNYPNSIEVFGSEDGALFFTCAYNTLINLSFAPSESGVVETTMLAECGPVLNSVNLPALSEEVIYSAKGIIPEDCDVCEKTSFFFNKIEKPRQSIPDNSLLLALILFAFVAFLVFKPKQ